MKIITIVLAILLSTHLLGKEKQQGSFQLVWADEFNTDGKIDKKYWSFEQGFVRNHELQWYQKENAFCRNGYLVIEAQKVERPNPLYKKNSHDWRSEREKIQYTSSSITTRDKFEFKYGRMEVRAKVSNLTGTWPAIWTLGSSCEWPSNGEVDIMENYRGMILANYAWGTDTQWNAQWNSYTIEVNKLGEKWEEQFHIWRLDWNENSMEIYLDNQLLNQVDLDTTINGSYSCAGENPFRQAHYIILNLAIGGQQGGDPTASPFPNHYLIDYVRIYQFKQ